MRIVNITDLPRVPWQGQRLRVDHAALVGLDSGLDPGEHVVIRVQGEHRLARVVHVDFGLDETTYDLLVEHAVTAAELTALGAVEPAHRAWRTEDVMAAMCRHKRTEIGCEETCSTCVLNPDSTQGWMLQRELHDLG